MSAITSRQVLLAAILLAVTACGIVGPEPRAGTQAATSTADVGSSPGIVSMKLAGVLGQGPQGGTPVQPGFAHLPDRGDVLGYPRIPVVRREAAYTWRRADISEAHALRAIVDGTLTLTSPSGTPLKFRYDRHVEHASGDWTWIGHLVGGSAADDLVITFGANAVFGDVAQPDGNALRIAMRDGASWIVETDRALLSEQSKAVGRYEEPDFKIPPALAPDPVADGGMRAAAVAPSAAQTTITTVDVLVGYTPGFRNLHSSADGTSHVDTRLNFLVDLANEAYVNSGVNMRIRLVHNMAVNYADATANADALEYLTGSDGSREVPVPPELAPLRAAREQYGADLVTMIRRFSHPENVNCGVTWLIGGGQTTIYSGHEKFGYSVVSDGSDGGFFCEDTTYAHELGHNMGLAHDVETSMGDDGALDPDEYGRYPYSFGYRTGLSAGHFYTVMAYSDGQVVGYKVFSNPRIAICGGHLCGVANQADNARTLENTVPLIAQFRAQVVPEEPEAVLRGLAGDIDADGTDDLLWFNPTTRELYYWLINDGGIRLGKGGVLAPPKTTPRGLADFNGDGRADILLPSGQDIWVYLGNPSGTFTSGYVAQYPVGWDLVGVHDVDADGKADVIWHHPTTREIYYWLMDGSTVRIGRGGVTSPAATQPGTIGDFNGDGRADLVLPSGQDIWVYLGNASGSFNSMYVAPYPAGWNLVGAGDVNADGKDDLVWHHPGTAVLYHWLMNGGSIIAGNGGVEVPANTVPRVLGDFNADGRVDVLLPSNADIWTYLATTGGGYRSVYTAPYPVGWY